MYVTLCEVYPCLHCRNTILVSLHMILVSLHMILVSLHMILVSLHMILVSLHMILVSLHMILVSLHIFFKGPFVSWNGYGCRCMYISVAGMITLLEAVFGAHTYSIVYMEIMCIAH
jgi:hypothetical protein